MRVNRYNFAKAVGVQSVQVDRAIAQGVIERGEDGLIDLETSKRQWLEAYKHKPKSARQAARDRFVSDDVVVHTTDGGPAVIPSILDSQAYKMAYEAKLMKLRHDREAGELIPVFATAEIIEKVGKIIGNALSSLPTNISKKVMILESKKDIEKAVADEIESIKKHMLAAWKEAERNFLKT